jgi:hypothetical protein
MSEDRDLIASELQGGVAHRLARERIDHNCAAARPQGDGDKNGNGETSGKVTPALP